MARAREHHASQYSDVGTLSLNWPVLSHFDLGIGYTRTEVKPAWRIVSNIQALTDYYGQYGTVPPGQSYTTPTNSGQVVTDSNGILVDTSILIGNSPVISDPGTPTTVTVMTIQPNADTAVVRAAWYLHRNGWTPFARASFRRDWISYTRSLGSIHDRYKTQHDGYLIGVGAEVPIRRVVLTAEFTYNDLIKKPDLSTQDTRVYAFGLDANAWLTARVAAFIQLGIADAKVNLSYSYSYGGGVRVRL